MRCEGVTGGEERSATTDGVTLAGFRSGCAHGDWATRRDGRKKGRPKKKAQSVPFWATRHLLAVRDEEERRHANEASEGHAEAARPNLREARHTQLALLAREGGCMKPCADAEGLNALAKADAADIAEHVA